MVPEPVPSVVEVSAAGVPPLQMVWFVPITPAVAVALTVIVTGVVYPE